MENKIKKILIIIQARSGSTRLPNKMTKKIINNKTTLELIIERLSKTKSNASIIVATTNKRADDKIERLCNKKNILVFRGNENDVLDRYYQTTKKYNGDIIVRLTGDCPILDPDLIDTLINIYQTKNVDYVSNTIIPTYPDGLDIEIFSFKALEKAWKNATLTSEREHVTPYIKSNSKLFKLHNVRSKTNLSKHRWTLDEENDLKFIKCIYKNLYKKKIQNSHKK